MIEFYPTNYEDVLSKEWIVTNGLGGYASSTIIGANTRRYHGILIASINPPTERKMFVSKVEEKILLDGHEFKLSTNEYPGTVYPEGYHFIKSFDRDPLPTTLFSIGEARLEKSVFMVHGSNTTIIEYRNTSRFEYPLWLNPLYVYRDFHSIEKEKDEHAYKVTLMGRTQAIRSGDNSETLYFRHSEGRFTESRAWNRNMQFRIDASRGHEFSEDVYSLGYLEHHLQPGQSLFLTFTLDRKMIEIPAEELKSAEIQRLDSLEIPGKGRFFNDLVRSGDQFLVKRRSTGKTSIIAGYHWFSDWGRDSMIALRGLCISTGKQEEAADVILTFLSYLHQGLIPNRFPDYDGEELEYNTIDATLWLFAALYDYDIRFKDEKFLEKVLPKLTEIIEHQIKGTLHNIKMQKNGLLSGGSKEIQITWMDAKLGDIVFTPRDGCAVEINALWYNALKTYEYVCKRLNKETNKKYQQIASGLRRNFRALFWNEKGYLNDLVNEEGLDQSIRPNQIYAVSLPFTMLTKKEEKLIVKNVCENLVTDYGLRTLDEHHPDFKSEYAGDLMARDAAYHQGTVWPFLLPEYCLAYLKVHQYNSRARKTVQKLLQPLKKHFYGSECLYGISEVFDGKNPSAGKGCIQQAWSVSNIIYLMDKGDIRMD